MIEHITQCIKCSSTTFLVHEKETWFAKLDSASGELSCCNPDCEIEYVTCEECGTMHSPTRFATFNFN